MVLRTLQKNHYELTEQVQQFYLNLFKNQEEVSNDSISWAVFKLLQHMIKLNAFMTIDKEGTSILFHYFLK